MEFVDSYHNEFDCNICEFSPFYDRNTTISKENYEIQNFKAMESKETLKKKVYHICGIKEVYPYKYINVLS